MIILPCKTTRYLGELLGRNRQDPFVIKYGGCYVYPKQEIAHARIDDHYNPSFFIAHVATSGQAADTGVYDGPYKGKELSAEELQKVLQDHAEWLEANKGDYSGNKARTDKRWANLEGANLNHASLRGANLQRANLQRANLSFANLEGANLTNARLSGANLQDAHLEGAILRPVKLTGANLYAVDLSGADLRGSILCEANLSYADLNNTNLEDVNLSGADLSGAHLNWVDSSRVIGDMPSFLGAKGLSNIEIDDNLAIIVDLRKKFKEAGFKSEEKSLTSALRKHELHEAGLVYCMFETFLIGGKLTDFGANPAGALIPLVALIFVFVWFYLVAIRRSEGNMGIWRVRPENRLIKDVGEPDRELVTGPTLWRSLVTAFYFSILSAFYFGWREVNVSNWIVRIQKKEYALQATGWVRMVSGIQSLISLYLVALFLLTYFGNPFE